MADNGTDGKVSIQRGRGGWGGAVEAQGSLPKTKEQRFDVRKPLRNTRGAILALMIPSCLQNSVDATLTFISPDSHL